jgi:hypothetical protein
MGKTLQSVILSKELPMKLFLGLIFSILITQNIFADAEKCHYLFEQNLAQSAYKLDVDPSILKTQCYGVSECVLVSIFNSLKIGAARGNSILSKAMATLEKNKLTYDDFYNQMAEVPSLKFKNQNRMLRLKNDWTVGVEYTKDLPAILKDINAMLGKNIYSQKKIDRMNGESDTDFVVRVHNLLAKSLSRNVPPQMNYSKNTWSKYADEKLAVKSEFGHAITVTAVSKLMTDQTRNKYFQVKAFEQLTGKYFEMDFKVDPRALYATTFAPNKNKLEQFDFTEVVSTDILDDQKKQAAPFLSVFLRDKYVGVELRHSIPGEREMTPLSQAELNQLNYFQTGENVSRWQNYFISEYISGDFRD